MSKYTIDVYTLMKNGFDFGLDDYEIFNEEYRPILNNAILEFYKFREIGFLNPYQWRDRLRARLDLIMRNKYNALYEAKAIDFNPLYNIELHEDYERTIENETSARGQLTDNTNSNSSSDVLNLSSRFPSEEMTENDLSSNLFVDNATKQKSNVADNTQNTQSSNDISNGSTTEKFTHTTQGSSAGLPFSKAMLQLKDFYSKYDLDRQVINDLSDLFINIW